MPETPNMPGTPTATAKLNRRDTLKGAAMLAVLPLASAVPMSAAAVEQGAAETPFDSGWAFLRGDAEGAQEPGFDAHTWRTVDLPHDWSIEDLPSHPETSGIDTVWQDCNCPDTAGPFSRMKS